MLRALLRRLVQSLALLFGLSFAIYGLMGLMPGDPIDLMIAADPRITSADAARLKALYGLDRPLFERYGAWLKAALAGDLGYSRLYGRPVLEVMVPRLVNTLWLMGPSLVLALALAVLGGVLAARNPGGRLDAALNLLAFAAFSLPSFWLALLLILLFAVELGWLPPGGVASVGDGGLWDRARHLVLPVLTLTLLSVGTFLRFTRAALIEALGEDFMRTARAKGCSRAAQLWVHALPHALLPLITVAALHFGTLLSGALVVETVFAYAGMGKLIYDAILGNDYNLALAALMLGALLTLSANLLADLLYLRLDPRIREGV